jgi:hypothetical protein
VGCRRPVGALGRGDQHPLPDPFDSTTGPTDGPVVHHGIMAPLGVITYPGPGTPIGVAHPTTWRPGPRRPIALFWIDFDKQRLPGLWECRSRQFIPAAGDPK